MGSFLKTLNWSKFMFLEHYFNSVCESNLFCKIFALVQSSENSYGSLRSFTDGEIPNYSCKVAPLTGNIILWHRFGSLILFLDGGLTSEN